MKKKSTCCSFRGLWFSMHMEDYNCAFLLLKNSTPSSALRILDTHVLHAHLCRQNTYNT